MATSDACGKVETLEVEEAASHPPASDACGKVETLEVEEAVSHPPAKVWKAYIQEVDKTLPATMPGHVDAITYVHGPPHTVGSVFVVSYHEDITHYDFIKLRWDEMNHEEHKFKCTLIEGGALNKHFSHLAYSFAILPGPSSDSCIMHFIVEFVDIGEHSFHDFIKYELEKSCKSLDSYLLNVA